MVIAESVQANFTCLMFLMTVNSTTCADSSHYVQELSSGAFLYYVGVPARILQFNFCNNDRCLLMTRISSIQGQLADSNPKYSLLTMEFFNSAMTSGLFCTRSIIWWSRQPKWLPPFVRRSIIIASASSLYICFSCLRGWKCQGERLFPCRYRMNHLLGTTTYDAFLWRFPFQI